MNGNIETNQWEPLAFEMRIKVFSFVYHLFKAQLSTKHTFHNWKHTCNVVQSVKHISRKMRLSPEEKEIVILAAWFHDTGHVSKCIGHEEESMKIAENFLNKYHCPQERIKKIIQCIEATKMPQSPKDILGQILCDADLYHLSTRNYLEGLSHLREEWASISNTTFSDQKWVDINLSFLKTHRYYTQYCQAILETGKQKNIKQLEKHKREILNN